MSKDLNKVQVIGRLGADPEIQYTSQGSAITRMRIASTRTWRTSEGETREDTEWFRVVAWNKLGEICSQYLTKGSKVYIEGRLQTRSWDDPQSGQKRYNTEVIANDMIMLDSKRDGGAPTYDEAPDMGYGNEPEPEPDHAPAARPAMRATPNHNASNSNGNGRPAPARQATPPAAPRRPTAPPQAQIDDEDLPF
ncbi:MAG: single-stranded DNA-binding protein [Herpetosiphon sp.]